MINAIQIEDSYWESFQQSEAVTPVYIAVTVEDSEGPGRGEVVKTAWTPPTSECHLIR